MTNEALVAGHTTVAGGAVVRDKATVTGNARVAGDAVVPDTTRVDVDVIGFADGLRALADLCEAHPDLVSAWRTHNHSVRVPNTEAARKTAERLGGDWQEHTIRDKYWCLEREIGGGVRLRLFTGI